MKTAFQTLTAIAAVCLFAGSAFAQYQGAYRGSSPVVPGYRGPSVVHRHASTFEEGILRGQADLVRAYGEYALNTSAAAIQYQEAYSRCLENRKRGVQTYFEVRAINRARAEVKEVA